MTRLLLFAAITASGWLLAAVIAYLAKGQYAAGFAEGLADAEDRDAQQAGA